MRKGAHVESGRSTENAVEYRRNNEYMQRCYRERVRPTQQPMDVDDGRYRD